MSSMLIESLAAGGPVAILAGIIFIMYCKDRHNSEKSLRQDRMFMEDRLTGILEKDQESREKNTSALTELTTQLRLMNGRRKQ